MRFSRRQLIAYLALAAVVVAVGVRYLVLDEPAAHAGGERLVLAPVSSAAPAAPTAPGGVAPAGPSAAPDLLVHVCGAVRRPGVIRLPQGARVADAIEQAGGATARGNLAAVNLAARVADGQQIVVPERSGSGEGSLAPVAAASEYGGAATSAAAGPVNINLATLAELDALPGIGPATAQKIVDYRTANGGFKSVEELKNVPGIGDAKFEALKDAVSI
jgi:competence protein ComEA